MCWCELLVLEVGSDVCRCWALGACGSLYTVVFKKGSKSENLELLLEHEEQLRESEH